MQDQEASRPSATPVVARETAPAVPRWLRLRRLLAFPALLLVLIALGSGFRSYAGIALEPDSIRAQIDALGWRGPAAFVGLVTFRQFLLLPALLLLTVGGLVFGATGGAVFGAAGIVLSACVTLLIARTLGRTALPRSFRTRLRSFEARGHRVGLWLVGIATAHPTGPIGLAHWLAAFSTAAAWTVLLTIAPSAVVRAGLVSTFGAALADWGSPQSVLALLLFASLVAPLAHRRVRARIFGLAAR